MSNNYQTDVDLHKDLCARAIFSTLVDCSLTLLPN